MGEIQFLDEFYTFSDELAEKVRAQAIKAYKEIDGKGLSRVDFFIDKKANDFIINKYNDRI